MFNTDSQPTLWRVGRRLWRVGRQLHNAGTHSPIGEEMALESADYSSESADSNADPPKIGVCVWVLSENTKSHVGSFSILWRFARCFHRP